MFRTTTSNVLLATGGKHLLIAQEHETEPNMRRYAIIDSATLQPHLVFTGPAGKEALNAAVQDLIDKHAVSQRKNRLDELLSEAQTAPAAPVTAQAAPAAAVPEADPVPESAQELPVVE